MVAFDNIDTTVCIFVCVYNQKIIITVKNFL